MKRDSTPSTAIMPAGRACPRCGAPLGGFGPEELCGACLFDSGLAADEPMTELDLHKSGSRPFGDYELIEEIARGGMGVIFKARQLSLNRVVAVKMILRGEFAGVAELARFRAEAETAARLQHPNIVSVHEVGEHEGKPFFSMDYVAGQNLAQLVGNSPLPAARAAKYLKIIAEAVQYAHEKGVLHRDLKPSNILVDKSDQLRITDFGLAKQFSTQDPGLRTQNLTLTGQVLGSPNFMPPEQAEGGEAGVGPASDIYSLGAVLYHLLVARPPFVADSVPATLRLVAESEPISPRLLNASVPRDLETICLKCLQKEPHKRYGSAQDLAQDLNYFLLDKPIRARPVGQVEKFSRWCRRNRALAATGGAVLVLLLTVAIGSAVAALRINRARVQAEAARQSAEANEAKSRTEAVKSEQVSRFLKGMLNGISPSAALGRDTSMLREVLDKTAERVGTDLNDQPQVEAELRNTLGEVYYAIGLDKKAEAMHRTALALRMKIFGDENLAVAESQHNLGLALYAQDEGPEAEILLRHALATRQRLLGGENLTVAESLNSLGLELAEHHQSEEAENLFRKALSIRRKQLPGGQPALAVTLNNLATTLNEMGKSSEAEQLSREALEIQRKFLGNEHPDTAISLYTLATALFRQGKFSEAETIQREGVTIQRKMLGKEHPDLAKSLWRLAEVLSNEGKNAEAETVQRESLAMLQKLYGSEHPALDWPPFTLAEILYQEGKMTEAESLFRETLALGKRKYGDDNWLVLDSLNRLADLLRGQTRTDEATVLYQEALATASRMPSSAPQVDVVVCWSSFGLMVSLRQQGRLEEAESVFREVMAKAGKSWVNYPGAWELSTDILTRRGKYRDAEQFFTIKPTLTVVDKYGNARPAHGDFHARVGRWNDAAADFSAAIELEPENVENYHRLAPLLVQSGRLDDYRENCRKSLQRFASTDSPAVAERIAKDCLILPASGVNLEAVMKLADVAISVGTKHPGITWIQVTKSLAEYRQHHWANAVEWAQKALANTGVLERDTEACLVLAMAKQQLNQPAEARADLSKAVEIVEMKLPKLESGDIGDLWGDWIIAHSLMSEARTLIEQAPVNNLDTPKAKD